MGKKGVQEEDIRAVAQGGGLQGGYRADGVGNNVYGAVALKVGLGDVVAPFAQVGGPGSGGVDVDRVRPRVIDEALQRFSGPEKTMYNNDLTGFVCDRYGHSFILPLLCLGRRRE